MDPARPMHSPAAHSPDPAYGRHVLAALTCAYALNIADCFVVSTLIEPIKHEFAVGDRAVGLLTGAALAVFYVAWHFWAADSREETSHV